MILLWLKKLQCETPLQLVYLSLLLISSEVLKFVLMFYLVVTFEVIPFKYSNISTTIKMHEFSININKHVHSFPLNSKRLCFSIDLSLDY